MHIPYHQYLTGAEEIDGVTEVLRSGWLTSGIKTVEFEARFSELKNGAHALAVNSCTSALFLILKAMEIGPGDEVITTPLTFAATANVIVHCGATPVFADVDPRTLNIDPAEVAKKITPRTRAIIAVHLGGNPCDLDALLAIATMHNLKLIEDCAHAIEGSYKGKPIGTIGHASAFSFYPTKNITTAEGGMIVTSDNALATSMNLWRKHGMDKSAWERTEGHNNPFYDVVLPGYKCNLTDLQAALGLAQMKRLSAMAIRRKEIAEKYNAAFSTLPSIRLVTPNPDGEHSLHLYLILVEKAATVSRNDAIQQLQEKGVEISINYLPVHLFTWYQKNFGFKSGDFPHAEFCGSQEISLPFYPSLTDEEVAYVIEVVVGIFS
jgi:dTDP-4-amino-4,6-dideoxygalactose transaminase